jgi:hypothetical protein
MIDVCAALQTAVVTSLMALVAGAMEHILPSFDCNKKGRAGGGWPERDGPK